jgi:hypothetical protein
MVVKVDQKILKRLDELIELGENVLKTRRSPPANVIGDDRVDTKLANQWVSSTLNLLIRVFGEKCVYVETIKRYSQKYLTYSIITPIYGVLKSTKDDYEHESIFELKTLITAELFSDFLEQAKILKEAGYFQPAAVIIGCVLEDGLRKLCTKNGISISSTEKIDKMNADLAKNGIYNLLTQKQITAYADLRNKAAHGKWNEFSADDVKQFEEWTYTFMENHFS